MPAAWECSASGGPGRNRPSGAGQYTARPRRLPEPVRMRIRTNLNANCGTIPSRITLITIDGRAATRPLTATRPHPRLAHLTAAGNPCSRARSSLAPAPSPRAGLEGTSRQHRPPPQRRPSVSFLNPFGSRRAPRPRRRPAARPLALDSLNDRVVPASLTVSDLSIVEGDFGTQTAMVTVRLSGPVNPPVNVGYSTANGTALAGSDYTAVTGTLTFLKRETVKTIQIPISGDLASELDETFFVNQIGRASCRERLARLV